MTETTGGHPPIPSTPRTVTEREDIPGVEVGVGVQTDTGQGIEDTGKIEEAEVVVVEEGCGRERGREKESRCLVTAGGWDQGQDKGLGCVSILDRRNEKEVGVVAIPVGVGEGMEMVVDITNNIPLLLTVVVVVVLEEGRGPPLDTTDTSLPPPLPPPQ